MIVPSLDGPLPERLQHDRVTRDTQTIADAAGAIGLPWRAEGLLGRLERRGDIGRRERQAGEEFARLFGQAHLHPLRAADLSRTGPSGVPVSGHGADIGPHGSEYARRRVLAALDALGGQASPCGACAWFVLGCEMSIREWALRKGWAGKPLPEQVAKGTLIGTLGMLARHFGT